MDFRGLYAFLELFGYLLRPIGALVFGVALGWLAVRVLKADEPRWQALLGVVLGLLATFVLLGHWVGGGGTLGAFGLGVGGGVLVWGLVPFKKSEDE